jgi:hypothetical protein
VGRLWAPPESRALISRQPVLEPDPGVVGELVGANHPRPRTQNDRADLVDTLMGDERADALRDNVAWLVAPLMEAEIAGLTHAELGAPPTARPSAMATANGGGTPRR